MRFRLYPEGRRLYFEVRIYATKRGMQRAIRQSDRWLGITSEWAQAEAVCRSFKHQRFVRGRWRTGPPCGVLFLHRGRLGAGIVAHEIAHAAVQYARRVRLSGRRVWRSVGGDEAQPNERFARITGDLNAQFWQHYYQQRRAA